MMCTSFTKLHHPTPYPIKRPLHFLFLVALATLASQSSLFALQPHAVGVLAAARRCFRSSSEKHPLRIGDHVRHVARGEGTVVDMRAVVEQKGVLCAFLPKIVSGLDAFFLFCQTNFKSEASTAPCFDTPFS